MRGGNSVTSVLAGTSNGSYAGRHIRYIDTVVMVKSEPDYGRMSEKLSERKRPYTSAAWARSTSDFIVVW